MKREEDKRESNTFRKIRIKKPFWASTLNRIEYLSNKVASELTSNEIKELSHFRKDCKMASISKNSGETLLS